LRNEILPNSPKRVLSFESVSSPKVSSPLTHSPSKTPSTKPVRKIQSTPFKILDAPNLQDDFYLNLVDWSSSNILAVGLADTVYLW
jgi:cell division cycle 20-like protein 1, cofactor of APC complex